MNLGPGTRAAESQVGNQTFDLSYDGANGGEVGRRQRTVKGDAEHHQAVIFDVPVLINNRLPSGCDTAGSRRCGNGRGPWVCRRGRSRSRGISVGP